MARLGRALRRLLPAIAFMALASVSALLYGCVVIAGGSMEPAVSAGDVLVFRRAPVTVAEQDLVLVARPGWSRPVVHRVVAVTPEGGLLTRGDANPIADRDPVPPAAVAGRGVAVVRASGLLRSLAAWSRRARLLLQPKTSMR